MLNTAGTEWFDRPGGEPVELHEPSPGWLDLADQWMVAIQGRLESVRPRIEHVGSTAVPGLVAKPVVDLQLSVPDVADELAYRPGLESLGLVLRAREPEHRFFRPPAGQPRTVHVHVCRHGSEWERVHLLFRDELRAKPDLAAAYARLKEGLAREVGSDRFAYTECKTEFIRGVVESADRRSKP
ncbi:MAG: GrpB family protein [Nocardioidaceae bacterium]